MFQGSRNVASGEHFTRLMAEGGRLNATTWFDRTNYFETVPKGAYELALWMEADRHGHLLDAVNQENLDNQRDVVKEEKRQRYDNVPYGHALIETYAAVFPPEHPYHHPTIGSMEDLDAASVEDVHAFFRRLLRAQQHRPDPRRRPRPRRRGSPRPSATSASCRPRPSRARGNLPQLDADHGAGAGRARRGRAQRPAPRRVPAAGGQHRGVLRRAPRARHHRRAGDLPAGPAARAARAGRQRGAGPRHGLRRRRLARVHRPRHRRRPGPRHRRGRAPSRSSSGSPTTGPPRSRWSPRSPRPSGPGCTPWPARRSGPT